MRVPHRVTGLTNPSSTARSYIRPASADLSAESRALTGLGQAINGLAASLKQVEEDDGRAWAAKTSNEVRLWAAKNEQDMRRGAQPGAWGYTESSLKAYDDYVAEIAKTAPTEAARNFFIQQTNEQRTSLGLSALEFESTERLRYRNQEIQEGITAGATAIYEAPSEQRDRVYTSVFESNAALISSMDIPEAEKQARLAELREQSAQAGALADAQDRPGNAVQWAAAGRGDGEERISRGYYTAIRSAESGNRNIANLEGTSSAFGPYQFTKGTWEDLIKRNPDLGLSAADRFNAEAQEIAIKRFTEENADILESAGIPVNNGTLYMMHFLGKSGGVPFLKAPANDPAEHHVSAAAAAANRSIFYDRNGNQRTVAQVIEIMTAKVGGPGDAVGVGTPRPTYYQDLTPEQRETLFNKANARLTDISTEAKKEVELLAKNALAEYTTTGTATVPPTRDQFIRAFGPNEGMRKFEDYESQAELGRDIHSLSGLTPAEISALLVARQPVPGSTTYDADTVRYSALQKAAAATQKQFNDDPGGFVAQWSAPVNRAYAEYLANPTPETAANFAAASEAEMGRRGIPVGQRKILPKQAIDSLAAQLEAPLRQEGAGQELVRVIQSQRELWGDYWPDVYRQLAPQMSSMTKVIGSGIRENAAFTLAENKDLSTQDLLKVIPESSLRVLQQRVAAAFTPLTASTLGSDAGGSAAADFVDQGIRLAALYMKQDGRAMDESLADAMAARAYDDLFGFKYETQIQQTGMFTDNNTNIRLPVGAPVSFTEINYVLEELFSIEDYQIKVPLDDMGGLSEDFMLDSARQDIAANGTWVTSPDDGGVTLLMNGAAVEVFDPQSETYVPLSFTWEEISQMFGATGGGFRTGMRQAMGFSRYNTATRSWERKRSPSFREELEKRRNR